MLEAMGVEWVKAEQLSGLTDSSKVIVLESGLSQLWIPY